MRRNEFLRKISVFIVVFQIGVLFNYTNAQKDIEFMGTGYSENFNTLGTSGGTWTNALPNWFAMYTSGGGRIIPTTYVSNDGQQLSNGLTSFGTTSASDRALGYAPYGNTGEKMYVAWHFKNTTGKTINYIVVNWTGEQWGDYDVSEQSVVLNYIISSSPITEIDPLSPDFQTPSGMEFVSPVIDGNNVSLNGNLTGNKASFTHTITENIPNGSEIMIIWEISDLGTNSHLMAIDDVTVTARANQTITFGTPAIKNFGDASFSSNATASSDLAVTLTSSNTNVATISGTNIVIVGPGRSTITASQAGNAGFNAATPKGVTLNVKPKIPTVIEATNISTTSLQANWSIDNGLNDAGTTYILQISTNKTFPGTPTQNSSVKNLNFSSLTPNSIYYYRVYAINNSNASVYSEASAITTGTDYVSTNAGSWDVASNWDLGPVNNIANSIKILHDITLSEARDSVITNTLWLTSTGKLTTNQKIHVTNQLIIEVDANGVSGEIINSSNIFVGNNAKIIVRKTFNANQWSFMGFPYPVSAATVYAQGQSTPLTWGSDYSVYQYSGSQRDNTGQANTSGQGLNWVSVPGQQFEAKKGYIIASPTSRVIDFTIRGLGRLDIFGLTNASATLGTYTTNSFAGHQSWNLVTSPYFSPFELRTTSEHEPYYIYNAATGNYWSPIYSTDLAHPDKKHVVYPFQSFFVQARGNTMNFSAAGKQKRIVALEASPLMDEIYLTLSDGNTVNDDEMRLRFKDDASTDYVIGEDAAKMYGTNQNINYIYSKINGYPVAVNTLPYSVTQIDLESKFSSQSNYKISLSNKELINKYSSVQLFDKQTGTTTDLIQKGFYNFTVASPATTNRFQIKLVPQVTTGVSIPSNEDIKILSNSGNVRIEGIENGTQIKIYDLKGSLVLNKNYNSGDILKLNSNTLYLFDIYETDMPLRIKNFVQ